jgi:hypothetical protein
MLRGVSNDGVYRSLRRLKGVPGRKEARNKMKQQIFMDTFTRTREENEYFGAIGRALAFATRF